ncbi:MAG: hypothetical protein KC653_03540, partial [Candidatus Andersenbacteria bacterium]|nr:hypothetical protein [Candidatus Andersenbacteria bacterium]
MTDSEDKQKVPVESFLDTLGKRIFDRIIQGRFNYEKDMRELQRYREQAKKVNALGAEARILNTIA